MFTKRFACEWLDGQNALHCAETHELALDRCTNQGFSVEGFPRIRFAEAAFNKNNVSSTAMIESIDKQSQFSTYTILGCPFCDPLLKA